MSNTHFDGNDGGSDPQNRQLTIGLGSALDAFAEANEVDKMIINLDSLCEEKHRERLTEILDLYQEQPHLLDPHLPSFLSRLVDAILQVYSNKSRCDKESKDVEKEAHAAAFCAQQLIKVRGHKVAVRHFPHEVHHVEAVLNILELQNTESTQNWETRYVLLLWMSMLVLIPFHLARFDTHINDKDNINGSALDDAVTQSSEKNCTRTVIERILLSCKRYLPVANKNQQAASLLAAKFLTRPEIVKLGHLAEFLDWIAQKLSMDTSTEFGKTGALLALAAIYKHGKRQDILQYASSMLRVVTMPKLKESKNMQIRKLTIKIIQRLGLTFLKAKVATWRYQRGCRSLALTLGGASDAKIPKKEENHNSAEKDEENEEEEDFDELYQEDIETVIEELLEGLKSSETIIRWSAAKGIGRITGRLPKDFADEVVSSLLQLFDLKESDGAWHGGCLAIAELARRGLLLPERLEEVVRITELAFVYDERRGNFSVGSHVRDAACYVSWSLARAFSPKVLTPFLPQIAAALLTVAVFDREVNCRRAASASFQENVGRQGADCLPNAIDILTTVDYHAVGSRPKCFTVLSLKLANYDRQLYGRPLIRHLLKKKVGHWDGAVRELTALSMGCMAKDSILHLDISHSVLPELLKNVEETRDLYTRHGSIIAIGQIVSGISVNITGCASNADRYERIEKILGGKEIINRIKAIISLLNSKMALRGSGGEIIRSAVTGFIQDLSEAHFPAHEDSETLNLWKITLDENLSSTDPTVQEKSVLAAAAYVKEYCTTREACDEVLKSYLSNLDTSELHRRGFSLAIGSLPEFALVGRLDQILVALIGRCTVTPCSATSSLSPCRASGVNLLVDLDGNKTLGPEQERWAEGRRDVVRAISRIVKTVGVCEGSNVTDSICEANIVQLYECYLRCMDDYTVDRRGDVGAWVREAAMTGLEELTLLAAQQISSRTGTIGSNKNAHLLPEICAREMMTKLSQQAVEKIDRTRGHAAKIFATILFDKQAGKLVPRYLEIIQIFSPILNYTTKGSSMDFETLMIEDNEKFKKSNKFGSDMFEKMNIDETTKALESYGWTVESATFPYFTALLRFQEYRERIILGLIVSVGGLTERLVVHSSKALFKELEIWENISKQPIKNVNGQIEFTETDVKTFCNTVLQVFDTNKRNDRITVPLFKFVERLLTSGHLDSILSDGSSKFPFELFTLTKREVCGGAGLSPCNDPNKLMSAADVLCALLQSEEAMAKQKCLVQLSIFLCHKFPRIRKATASKLFEALLTYPNILSPNGNCDDATVTEDEIEEKLDAINSILSDTTWDTTPVEDLRPLRNKLCDMMGVPAPALVKKHIL